VLKKRRTFLERMIYLPSMIFTFLKLQWKSFFRGESVGLNVMTKVLKWFWIVYFGFITPLLGVLTYKVLKEKLEIEDPFLYLNKNLIYVFAYWIVMRYFIQPIPVVSIKPLLLTPISKSQIVRHALGKSIFSFFNIIAFFYLIPLTWVLINKDYQVNQLIGWNLTIIAFVYITNYLNFILNNNDKLLYSIAAILVLIKLLEYYSVFDFTIYSEAFFYSFYTNPLYSLLPWVFLIWLYFYVFKYFKNGLYIDLGLKKRTEEAKIDDFSWLDRFGKTAVFLKNDLRLIKRSKRARGTVLAGIFFLFYGFIFYFSEDIYGPSMTFFGYLFASGGFLFMFGAFVPSWDSQYYSLMMCQNIEYKEYIKSKWSLVVIGTSISTLLACFIYSFLGADAIFAVLAGGLYNIGINGYLTLWAGAFTKTPIDLDSNKNIFGDTKAFNMKTLLIALPQMALPIALFSIGNYYYSASIGCLIVGTTGILGILLKEQVFNLIIKAYKTEKYSTLKAYKQN